MAASLETTFPRCPCGRCGHVTKFRLTDENESTPARPPPPPCTPILGTADEDAWFGQQQSGPTAGPRGTEVATQRKEDPGGSRAGDEIHHSRIQLRRGLRCVCPEPAPCTQPTTRSRSQLHALSPPQGAVKSTRIPAPEGAPLAHGSREHSPPSAALPGASPGQSRLHPTGSWSLSSQRLASAGAGRPRALEAPGRRAVSPPPPLPSQRTSGA